MQPYSEVKPGASATLHEVKPGAGALQMWVWTPQERNFDDAESFRSFVTAQLLREELARLLPKDEPQTKLIEKPAEAALRQRM